MTKERPWRLVWALAVTEIVSWGSLYYAFSVLLVPMERTNSYGTETRSSARSRSECFVPELDLGLPVR